METTTQSYFWFVLSACAGGFIVLVGICMEVLADKKWFKNLKSFKFWEHVKLGGEISVIIGIAIEVIVAGVAAKEEWQTKQMAINNSPRNQPIASLAASVFLEESGTNRTNFDPNTTPADAIFITFLAENSENLLLTNNSWRVALKCSSFRKFESNGSILWFLEFDMTGVGHIWGVIPDVSVADADKWDTFVIEAPFLRENTEIVTGDMTMTINSVKRKFPILPQKVRRDGFVLKNVTISSR